VQSSAENSARDLAAKPFYPGGMFTLEQVTDIHDRLGNRDTLGGYLRALRDIGVEAYDSYVTDGHSEYFGADRKMLVGPAFHETFAIAEAGDGDKSLRYTQQVGDGGFGYVEMSRALADDGVEKWTFDTEELTINYLDKVGNVLLREKVG
jgi:uncharacterized protein YbcV (DUF1398 family)